MKTSIAVRIAFRRILTIPRETVTLSQARELRQILKAMEEDIFMSDEFLERAEEYCRETGWQSPA